MYTTTPPSSPNTNHVGVFVGSIYVYTGLSKKTLDTSLSDVTVLSFGHPNIVKDADVETFSVVYGAKETYFITFDNLSHFSKDICRALFYFHALTRWDMTSSFYQLGKGLGKAKFWKTWMKQHSNNSDSLPRIFIHTSW